MGISGDKGQPQSCSGGRQISRHDLPAVARRIHQDADSRGRRYRRLKQLRHLAAELCRHEIGEPGDVSARSGQAGDESLTDGVADGDEYDWDRVGRRFNGSRNGLRGRGYDQIRLEPDELRGEFGDALGLPFGPSPLDDTDEGKASQMPRGGGGSTRTESATGGSHPSSVRTEVVFHGAALSALAALTNRPIRYQP